MGDPADTRALATTPLSAYACGVALCAGCKRPVYQQTRYQANRHLAVAAARGHIRFAEDMHRVEGATGARDVCGACVAGLEMRVASDADDEPAD